MVFVKNMFDFLYERGIIAQGDDINSNIQKRYLVVDEEMNVVHGPATDETLVSRGLAQYLSMGSDPMEIDVISAKDPFHYLFKLDRPKYGVILEDGTIASIAVPFLHEKGTKVVYGAYLDKSSRIMIVSPYDRFGNKIDEYSVGSGRVVKMECGGIIPDSCFLADLSDVRDEMRPSF